MCRPRCQCHHWYNDHTVTLALLLALRVGLPLVLALAVRVDRRVVEDTRREREERQHLDEGPPAAEGEGLGRGRIRSRGTPFSFSTSSTRAHVRGT